LALRESGGVAGFRALRHRGGREVPVDDPGFLTGASGIGLALLAASTDLEPAWDRLLLLS
ncbi:hypothetical protein HY251_20940, partial [bacterium]|nr:hypothetical protein [bacterium]